jgi:hypothetical protein
LATRFRVSATYHLKYLRADRPSGQNALPGGSGEAKHMLWTITIILFILWVLGLVSSYTLGGWIHILLVLAVIVLIFNLLQGRRAL